MPRRLRFYAPNAVFHVTARTQGRQHWFDEALRDYICRVMQTTICRTDAKVRACVVMSNHLHLLVQQGNAPLCNLLQPLLRKTALAVQRRYGLTGHVFERRFGEIICARDEYLATLLDYIHNNPVKAQLCLAPGDWRWSSFAAYHGSSCELLPFVEPFDTIAVGVNAVRINGRGQHDEPSSPSVDLRDLLQITLRKLTSEDVDLQTLIAMRGRTGSRLRRELIAIAARAGYRGVQIARSLCVSESTVSQIAIKNRLPRSRLIAG